MSQEKTKQKTNRKEVSNMIEVARIFKVENKEESTLKAFVDRSEERRVGKECRL